MTNSPVNASLADTTISTMNQGSGRFDKIARLHSQELRLLITWRLVLCSPVHVAVSQNPMILCPRHTMHPSLCFHCPVFLDAFWWEEPQGKHSMSVVSSRKPLPLLLCVPKVLWPWEARGLSTVRDKETDVKETADHLHSPLHTQNHLHSPPSYPKPSTQPPSYPK